MTETQSWVGQILKAVDAEYRSRGSVRSHSDLPRHRYDFPQGISFDTMYPSISLRKATPPQNRQLNIQISNRKQEVDDSVGELAF